jgi:hypothetical protein
VHTFSFDNVAFFLAFIIIIIVWRVVCGINDSSIYKLKNKRNENKKKVGKQCLGNGILVINVDVFMYYVLLTVSLLLI